jgi:uncharacterized protein (UPF0333 family)
MKKIISIFLSIILVFSLIGCSKMKENQTPTQNKENTTSKTNEVEIATYNPEIKTTKINFGLNGDNGEYIEITIPSAIKDYCKPSYSSDFDEGWVKITIGATNDTNELFTIYASTDESYKSFEKEKNYKVIGTDGVYTVIWYEHNLSENLTDEVKIVISEIENYYTLIQDTITIKTPIAE